MMIKHLNDTYGFIRQGVRATLLLSVILLTACLVRVAAAWYVCSTRYDNKRSEYPHDRGYRAGSGQFFFA